ncbi:multidrug resistance efflux transporter family protein [Halobacillus halophilus]|uniref:DMT family transporter n=1 Tax=Halobacillus halophilus TaxID=1570 RepID=UPI00136A677F|nr:multidrug resistance efflux transporter family protein [Halobacillus halophilus]MYL31171.1 multidrug resistance efflux transporter family protein [Halobacillus halophilus]
MREILIGVAASMFFAVTFILNRSMELAGGSWMWSASLRFLFMVPFLLLIVLVRKNGKQVFLELKEHPLIWIGWSFVGFVLFYAPLTYAAAYGPGWLIAGTWQITIAAGILLTPFFYTTVYVGSRPEKRRERVPIRSLLISFLILAGVCLIQLPHLEKVTLLELTAGVFPVLVAAFCYPLGNRKMMAFSSNRLDTFQRILGMTLASLPFWLILSTTALVTAGPPAQGQVLQSFIVAVCSGVMATTLFFIATDRSRHQSGKLAAVEATQSTQVLFVLLGEVLLLSAPLPGLTAFLGIGLLVTGIILHSLTVKKGKALVRRDVTLKRA